ncbi:MAG TPA: BamA/TamA family outer membrane protein [Candidatus Sphingobacterium stercoripullorum]|nr:BamA/TamA family outer membrane protein [Candidatus Sphingobacterium stercoripullorum]
MYLKADLTKVTLILLISLFFYGCNAVKRVDKDRYLLTQNEIVVDGELIKDSKVYSLISQRPNNKIPVLGLPIGLHFYNLAYPDPEDSFNAWLSKKKKREERLIKLLSQKQLNALDSSFVNFNKWIQKSGEEPVVIREDRTERSRRQLERYYQSFGWFNTKVYSEIVSDEKKDKRAKVIYHINRHEPYNIGTLDENISSPIVDSLFQQSKHESLIQSKNQYNANDFIAERQRITNLMRNSGLYYFDQDYVGFEADTVNTDHQANITYNIPNRRVAEADSSYTKPFQIHKVNNIRIITDYQYENRNKKFSDSAHFKGYTLYSYDKLKFKPKAITDAIAITPKNIFKDQDRTLTYNQIGDLRIFQYPNISYTPSPNDTIGLDATILLTPRKKYTLGLDFDSYTSTIQQFGMGFSTNLTVRNLFRRAEILEVSGRGSVGSSKDAANKSKFFNISEVGGDVKLSFPRILFPVPMGNLIPKYMSPQTMFSLGFSTQNNIGLDRQGISGRLSYRWKPNKSRTNILELLNVQYVRNLNTSNYYNVYKTSYNRLNEIANNSTYNFDDPTLNIPQLGVPEEVNRFISIALNSPEAIHIDNTQQQEIRSIAERQSRLTENNLIVATNFSWIRDTRTSILDNTFTRFQVKLESAGSAISLLSQITNSEKNEEGNYNTFGVVFSQYAKLDIDLIKHWEINSHNALAFRMFAGIAIPYGNSKSIPFTRSYFAGGTNDNRGWRAYDLGPGTSGSVLDFNEANFKLAFNAEYRFTILGAFKSALFVDVGNIWNVLDDVKEKEFRFSSFKDLGDLAVASGFGLRYDFDFFVFRLDIGFKTHNPALPKGERWFSEYNFANAVYNIGINYPF